MQHGADLVVVGDAIIDELALEDGAGERWPGGAGLNLAVGLSILGWPVTLVASVGDDPDGRWLGRHLRHQHVRLLRTPTLDFTGVATSRRVGAEPTYEFNPPMLRRRLRLTDRVRAVIAGATAVVVNSFPFDDADQAGDLADAVEACTGLRVVDPNPRERLISDVADYRGGFEQVAARCQVAKVSDEDLRLLYGEVEEGWAVDRLLTLGLSAVLLTTGAGGCQLFMATGVRAEEPAADAPGTVVDTLGAGDATLASFVGDCVQDGLVVDEALLRRRLRRAMLVAAWTCRHPGGTLQIPR